MPHDSPPESRPALRLGERTKRFLQAEFNNEADGGVSPTTVFSATDSLLQWPSGDDLLPDQSAINEVAYDLLALAYKHGLTAVIADLGVA